MDGQYGGTVLDQKSWKTLEGFRSKLVKMAEIVGETGIVWKYCPTDKNLADLGSRGAGIHKMETRGCLQVPVIR